MRKKTFQIQVQKSIMHVDDDDDDDKRITTIKQKKMMMMMMMNISTTRKKPIYQINFLDRLIDCE